jgi:hypothetical protein
MNIRAGLLSLILLMVFFVTSAATAIEFTALGANTFTVAPGESFTIDIAVTNVSATSVQGITGRLDGLAAAGLTVTGGESALHHFVGICATFTGGCAGGIDSVSNVFFDPRNLAGGIYTAGDDRVSIVSALSLNPTVQIGGSDPGLETNIDDIFHHSELDITITLMADLTLVGGAFDLIANAEFSDGTDTIPLPGLAGFSVNVIPIPEPGTALLMGLGLAGLAGAGRRK